MIVVADTSPLNYLILIDEVELLHTIFHRVLVPPAVITELNHPHTPPPVKQWINAAPAWLEIQSPTSIDPTIQLGQGENAAISLALEVQAHLLLIDDSRARGLAEGRGFAVAGTLNILETAAVKGLVDLPTVIAKLKQTSFYLPVILIQDMLQRDAERKSDDHQ